MTEYKKLAVSPDGKRAVVTDGEKYAVIRTANNSVVGKWRDEKLLKSMILKSGYETLDIMKSSPMSPKRKSVARTDEGAKSKTSKQDKLIEDLGLQNFSSDVTNPNVWKSDTQLVIDLEKAQHSHLPDGAERFSYKCSENYNIVYIPVNRLKEVYQTKEALNQSTINRKAKEMKSGKAMPPVYIGYNYDVHDGHHSWNAAIQNGYTHVPCKVVGSDPEKVKEAIEEYKKVWKGFREDHWRPKPKKENSPSLIIDENKQNNPLSDEKVVGEKSDKNGTKPPVETEVFKSNPLIIDLTKGTLNTGKLIKRRVAVRGKNGKIFYRMQWVKPEEANKGDFSHPGVEHSTFHHHTDDIKDMEKRQSNKFPVVHHPTNELKIREHNYRVDKTKYAQAEHALKHGEKLPALRINPHGEVLDNHYLLDLAKEYGLSHVPVVVIGNPNLKKQLEERLKDKVTMEDEDGEEHHLTGSDDNGNASGSENGSEIVNDIEHFKKFTAKKYTKNHLMEEARKQGIKWNNGDKDGKPLPANSKISWMRASVAIQEYIKQGNTFHVTHDEKDVDKRMQQDGKDSIHKHFVKLFEKHNGDKDAFMQWARDYGITWKEQHRDPDINWMKCVVAVKEELAKGKMVDGVRTRQKGAMTEANRIVTDEVKSQVKALGHRHGKSTVMKRAHELGIKFDRYTKSGTELPENSNILWMRASEAIQKWISDGNNFLMGNEVDNGIKSTVGDYGGVKLSRMQTYAVDLAKRKSRNREAPSRKWAIKSLMVDKGIEESEANELYDKFMERARDAKIMIHFDPMEVLPNGVSFIDQLSSDGHIKNDYGLQRGFDRDSREIDERYMFGDDYDEATDEERPVYGVIDLFNKGLPAHPYAGEIAFVLNDNAKKRVTGAHQDSSSIGYGEEGKWLRSMEDPHQLIIDRWTSRWKQPKNADKQRERAFDSILDGKEYKDDNNYFEAHVHGNVDLGRDVAHIIVPDSWVNDKTHAEKLRKVNELAKLHNIPVYRHAPDIYVGSPTDGDEIRNRLRGR